MKDETRKKRAAAKLAELFGLDAPVEPTKAERLESAGLSREAEATLLYLEDRSKFQTKPCKICGKTFAVNRASIGYCSDTCRKVALEGYGIMWDPTARTPEDRWGVTTGGPEPLVVPPSVLPLLPEPSPLKPESLQSLSPEVESLSDVDALLASLSE